MSQPVITPQQLSDLFEAGRYHELIAGAQSAEVTAQSDPISAQFLAAALFESANLQQLTLFLSNLNPPLALIQISCRCLQLTVGVLGSSNGQSNFFPALWRSTLSPSNPKQSGESPY